jgi:two-component system, NtrC family, sensor kinase
LTVSPIPITNHDASDPSGANLERPGNDSQNWLSRWNGPDDSRGMQCRGLCRLLEYGPQPFVVIDLDRRIVLSNRAFSELVGYSRDELLGMSIMDLTAPQSLEVTRRSHAEVLATGQNERVTKNYRRKDGSLVPVELIMDVFRDDSGQALGLYAFITDIRERVTAEEARKQSEEALVESERRARALFDGIHDAVFVHDQEGRILDANPAACRQLGYTKAELLAMNTSQIDSPEFAAGFSERLTCQLHEGILRCEGEHQTKSGRMIPVEVTTSTIQYDSQIVVLAIFRDITERKALERTRREFAESQTRNAEAMECKNRALSESEARYRQLTEASLDAIVVADDRGGIALFNPAAEKVFGYESAQVLGQPLDLLIPGVFETSAPRSGECAASADVREFAANEVEEHPLSASPIVGKTVELMGRKRDSAEFPLELSLNAVEMNGRTQYIGSIRDQTERQRMRAMLAHTDKLASIGLLSAGVAHEINNPLAYVQNNLAVLQRETKGLLDLVKVYESSLGSLVRSDPEAGRRIDELAEEIDWPYIRDNLDQMIDRTRTGVKRVAGIVEKMRGLARTAPPQWAEVSLADLIENALEMMRGRLKHQHVEVSVQIHDTMRIDCVPDQICQVLLNLLINALQAIESSGRQEGGQIKVDARHVGLWVAISVADNGPGIEPEHRGRLFDPFFTTKPVGEGTGLGLAISHGIITGHGGRIEVESRPGEGACFRILLPERPYSNPTRPSHLPTLPASPA